MTYPEPERCRRTDGKKWRCGKNVVSGQKYCEGHLHRGRLRSRKPVEGSQYPSPDKIPHYSSVMMPKPLHKSAFIDTTETSPCKVSGNVDVKTTVADNGVKNSISTTISRTVKDHEDTQTAIISSASHLDKPRTPTFCKRKCSRISIDGREFDDGKSKCSNISVGCKNINDKSSYGRFMRNVNTYQGLEFFPKSVLQAQGCFRSHLHRSDVGPEPARCRRTDGKKWRCRKDALANQKYCEVHMHRGAKRHGKASQPSAFPTTIRIVSSGGHGRPIQTIRNTVDSGDLNTNLYISILASPLLGVNYDGSTSSSSSATTISDTHVAA